MGGYVEPERIVSLEGGWFWPPLPPIEPAPQWRPVNRSAWRAWLLCSSSLTPIDGGLA